MYCSSTETAVTSARNISWLPSSMISFTLHSKVSGLSSIEGASIVFDLIGVNKKSENKPDKMKENNIINNSNNKNNNNNRKNTEDIYNINNFYSSTVKIREKSLYQNVVVPNYEELDDDFFEDNCIEVRKN